MMRQRAEAYAQEIEAERESRMDQDEPVCRICYEGRDAGVLLRPCSCAGSIGAIHATCLARWLATRPELVQRGCDVCGAPWDCVRRPTVRAFARHHDWPAAGARLLRTVVAAPAGGDGGDPDAARAAAAAAALARLALRAAAFAAAVRQGRLALKVFAWGVRCVLAVDSRVDALLLPGPVADCLARLFPGLPCLQSAAALGPPAAPSLARRFVARAAAFAARPRAPVASPPAHGPDLVLGAVMLALDARWLKRTLGTGLQRGEPLRRMVPRAVGLIIAEPGGAFEDVATVVDHLVTSPLLVLHWLCVFPSYVYVLRLLLARCGLLAADARTLDLESGEGVAYHVALLAGAACVGTVLAALTRGVLDEYNRWAASYVIRDLSVGRHP